MKLACITDLHSDLASLSRILRDAGAVDAILLGGDLTAFGEPDEAEAIVRQAQAACPCVFAVAGNCDSLPIERRLIDLGISLLGRGVTLSDAARPDLPAVGLYGVSAMPPWTGRMYELTEKEIASALDAGHKQVKGAARQIVLSHCPPRDCSLDRIAGGAHVGSTALRAFIEKVQPALVLCGHIHEGRGIDHLGAAKIVNCGAAMWGYYVWIEWSDRLRVELCRA